MNVWIYAAVEGGEIELMRDRRGAFDSSSRTVVVQADAEPPPPGIQIGAQYRLRLSPPGRLFPVQCTGIEGLTFVFLFETDPSLPPEPFKPPPAPTEVPFKSLETPEMKKFLKWAMEHGDRGKIEEGVGWILDDLRALVELGDLALSALGAFLESVVDLFRQIVDPDVRAEVTDATTEMVETTAQEIKQEPVPDPDGDPDGNGDDGSDTDAGSGGDGTGDEFDGTGDGIDVDTGSTGEATDGIIETDPTTDPGSEPGGSDLGGEPGGFESPGGGGDGGGGRGGGRGGGGETDFGHEDIPRMKVSDPGDFPEEEEGEDV